MRVIKSLLREEFNSKDGDRLTVLYASREEDFGDSITLELHDFSNGSTIPVSLDKAEVGRLRDMIDKLYPGQHFSREPKSDVNKYKVCEEFLGEQGEQLRVRYTNQGEPYREGIDLDYRSNQQFAGMFLEKFDARGLRDLLNKLYPNLKALAIDQHATMNDDPNARQTPSL